MNSNFSSTRSNIILMLISVIGSLVFSVLIGTSPERNTQNSDDNEKKIGEVQLVESEVRKKSESGLGWEELGMKEHIHENDSVFTGPMSNATLNLDQYGLIHLNSNSLVVFNYAGDQIALNLKIGEITLNLNPEANIGFYHNNQLLEVSSQTNAKLRLARNNQGVLKIKGSGEKLNIHIQGKTRELDKSEEASVDQFENFQTEKFDVLLLKPELDEVFILSENEKNLILQWKNLTAPNDERASVVQISKHADFNEIVWSESTQAEMISLPSDGLDGVYHWRLFDQQSQRTLSTRGGFRIVHNIAPVLVLPQDRTQEIRHLNQSTSVLFAWKARSGGHKYHVQIATDPNFSKMYYEKSISKNTMAIELLQTGSYFWRVKMENEGINESSPWSSTFTFQITEGTLSLAATAALSPTPSPSAVATALLSPSPSPSAVATVLLSPTPSPSAVTKPVLKSAPKFVPKPVSKPVVPTVTKPPQKVSSTLEASEPVIKLGTPEIDSPANDLKVVSLGEQISPVVFIWSQVMDAESYDLEIAMDPNFKEITVARQLKNTRFLLDENLKPIRYYWRLRARNKARISEWSSTHYFEIQSGG